MSLASQSQLVGTEKLALHQAQQIQLFLRKKRLLQMKSLPMALLIPRKTPLRMIQNCEHLQLMMVMAKWQKLVRTVRLLLVKTMDITIQTVVQKHLSVVFVMHRN